MLEGKKSPAPGDTGRPPLREMERRESALLSTGVCLLVRLTTCVSVDMHVTSASHAGEHRRSESECDVPAIHLRLRHVTGTSGYNAKPLVTLTPKLLIIITAFLIVSFFVESLEF